MSRILTLTRMMYMMRGTSRIGDLSCSCINPSNNSIHIYPNPPTQSKDTNTPYNNGLLAHKRNIQDLLDICLRMSSLSRLRKILMDNLSRIRKLSYLHIKLGFMDILPHISMLSYQRMILQDIV